MVLADTNDLKVNLPALTDISCYFYFVSLRESDYNAQIHLVERRLMEV
jgi:hypothetical protein